jgi:Tfp pilus assembly protein PilN
MRAVNLLPRDVEQGRSRRRIPPILAVVGVVVAVTLLVGVLGMQASAQADGHRADLALTEAAIARLPKPVARPALPDVSAERSNRITALQSALATRVPVDKLLTELSYVVPDDVWLTGFTLSAPSEAAGQVAPSGSGVGGSVTIEGSTYSQPAIARFLARLSTLPSLDRVRLTQSARVEPQVAPSDPKQKRPRAKPKVVVTFTVNADLADGKLS